MPHQSDPQVSEGAAYPPHDVTWWPHSLLSSFTCPVCVQRCADAGQGPMVVGRTYIADHVDEWVKVDGVTSK